MTSRGLFSSIFGLAVTANELISRVHLRGDGLFVCILRVADSEICLLAWAALTHMNLLKSVEEFFLFDVTRHSLSKTVHVTLLEIPR